MLPKYIEFPHEMRKKMYSLQKYHDSYDKTYILYNMRRIERAGRKIFYNIQHGRQKQHI